MLSKRMSDKKWQLLIIVAISAFLVNVCTIGEAFAAGDAWIGIGSGDSSMTSGGTGSGANCNTPGMDYNDYTISCAGMSWIYYKYTGGNAANESDVKIVGDNTGTIPGKGAKLGGFWHFGINIRGGHFSDPYVITAFEPFYYGHWTTRQWSRYSRYSDPYKTITQPPLSQTIGRYSADHYATIDGNRVPQEVLRDYKVAYKITNGTDYTGSNLPDDLWGFCSSNSEPEPEPEPEPKPLILYGRSRVSNRSSETAPSGGIKDYADTDYSSGGNTVQTDPKEIMLGESVSITFSHIMASNIPTSDVEWHVERTSTFGGGFNSTTAYTVVEHPTNRYSSGGLAARTPTYGEYILDNLNSSFDTTQGDPPKAVTMYRAPIDELYYYDNEANVNSHNNHYLLRDYYKFQFTKEGEYTFCEKLYGNGVLRSVACSVVRVQDDGIIIEDDECPGSLTRGVSFVQTKVTNERLNNGWNDTVYAKPGDRVTWRHCYYPGAQLMVDEEVSRVPDLHPVGSPENEQTVYPLFDTKVRYRYSSSLYNNFSASKSNNHKGTFIGSVFSTSYGIGETTIRKKTDSYSTASAQPGNVFTETSNGKVKSISIASRWHSWECNNREVEETTTEEVCDEDGNCTEEEVTVMVPKSDTCNHGRYYLYANIDDSSATDQASVVIPYNFNLSTDVELVPNGEGVVYSGESVKLSKLTAEVEARYNSALRDTYATKTTSKTRIYIDAYVKNEKEGEAISNIYSKEIYKGEQYPGSINISDPEKTIAVPDEYAGRWLCVRSRIYPASSGDDLNWQNEEGSGIYAYSPEESCAIIAKKPSLEVWGGSFYSAGNVTTATSNKNNLSGVQNYSVSTTLAKYNFGSWVDYGMASLGSVTGLASGAALGGGKGYESNTQLFNYCNVVPLSFANTGSTIRVCPGTPVTGLIGTGGSAINKYDLVSYLNGKDDATYETVEVIGGIEIGNGKTVVYENKDGNIEINGNIKYAAGNYNSLTETPQLIIYAKNINIRCNVETIDAILIAEETVNTCSEYLEVAKSGYDNRIEGQKATERSRQLKITGMVIANKLIAGRTYGAATGTNSGEPAEIINYDTKTILWANAKADTSSSNTLNITYQHELAPRY